MKCLLVFDHVNDVIYTKHDKKFALHINEFAKTQGLISENIDCKVATNVIVQIFSPIVTSQRIMSCQFGNSYTSIQCQDGLNLTFEEYMGYLFVCIGHDDVASMTRFLSVCVTLARYLCGADVLLLKNEPLHADLFTRLIDRWFYLKSNDQSMFIEAIEQLTVNSDLVTTVIQGLREVVDKMQIATDCSKIHAMLFVENKFLGLYSSPSAKELSATDILFANLLSESAKPDLQSDEYSSPRGSPFERTSSEKLTSYQVLLTGTDFIPKCIPHVIHIREIIVGINLVVLLEMGNSTVSSNLYESFLHLHTMQTVQIQRDVETLRPVFENLDASVKKLCDALKKTKNGQLEFCSKHLQKKWDFMRKKYSEFMKTLSGEVLLRAESSTGGFLETLKELLKLTSFDRTTLDSTKSCVADVAKSLAEQLANFNEFFKAKALKNFTLGSRDSLTINKYLEEFPGLVHFIYVDRTNHRVTVPGLDFTSEETLSLTKKKIWSMIDFSRVHLIEGHLTMMWKDTTFNYAYFLWFEDTSGSPLKPIVFPTHATKALPQPGILCGDFYQKLKETCFPKMSPNKVRCYEIYCVHLGLATPRCVLEHTRRLAATIWELKGHPDHPIDLL